MGNSLLLCRIIEFRRSFYIERGEGLLAKGSFSQRKGSECFRWPGSLRASHTRERQKHLMCSSISMCGVWTVHKDIKLDRLYLASSQRILWATLKGLTLAVLYVFRACVIMCILVHYYILANFLSLCSNPFSHYLTITLIHSCLILFLIILISTTLFVFSAFV